jgi:hypothetical protein
MLVHAQVFNEVALLYTPNIHPFDQGLHGRGCTYSPPPPLGVRQPGQLQPTNPHRTADFVNHQHIANVHAASLTA